MPTLISTGVLLGVSQSGPHLSHPFLSLSVHSFSPTPYHSHFTKNTLPELPAFITKASTALTNAKRLPLVLAVEMKGIMRADGYSKQNVRDRI